MSATIHLKASSDLTPSDCGRATLLLGSTDGDALFASRLPLFVVTRYYMREHNPRQVALGRADEAASQSLVQ